MEDIELWQTVQWNVWAEDTLAITVQGLNNMS
jgi:hypothetical protein